jgi:hypothetical protein
VECGRSARPEDLELALLALAAKGNGVDKAGVARNPLSPSKIAIAAVAAS